MIVVDPNIVGYLYLTSPRSGQAEQLLLKDTEWGSSYVRVPNKVRAPQLAHHRLSVQVH